MNTIETMLDQPAVIALGWALIHFIWQGAFVALLLASVLRVFRGWSTNARYGAACVAMFLMMGAPAVTMALIYTSGNGETAGIQLPAFARRPELRAAPTEIDPNGLAALAGSERRLTQSDFMPISRRIPRA